MTAFAPKCATPAVLLLSLLGACTTQPAYRRPSLAAPAAWVNATAASATATISDREGWWTGLNDPAIDRLVTAALQDNPTLAEAAARIDLARATLAARGAGRVPNIGLTGNAGGARDRMGAGTNTIDQTSASLGLSLGWEIDLWGRVRAGRAAARERLAARAADAEGARLSIIGEIADTALALRACRIILNIRDSDIASRDAELAIGRVRQSFGSVAPVVVAAAESNRASALADRIVQAETCQRLIDALVALSGIEAGAVAAMIPPVATSLGDRRDMPIAAPAPFAPQLPATVLLGSPAVIAADREAAARWSEIAVARAERLPRIDLTAALTGQWLRALDSSAATGTGSAGVGLTGPLFDGGAGAANVRGAEAGYREALAQRTLAIRTTIRDIEDALAAQQSALERSEVSQQALAAARFTLRANEARWRAGSIAPYELEETRRQYRNAEERVVIASADRARAWVALMRRTGGLASDAGALR